ncbi:hypothetical protein FSP39_025470 [Pinctada imbricata]|uniref:5' exonuclease Apollo n=1 Tax=Pinctada imbricata TaxID=66713 RepID=A0AA88YSW3_PINIB|nr:hypothetical protein FSP39_025470 [Pinctada imbricata]
MEIGRNCIVYLDQDENEQMTVSCIDANHCPGAVMFLFEGYFGKILYTGDFRWSDQMEVDLLCSNIDHIDALYLDNTYCSPGCEFPSREEATEEIMSMVRNHPDHDIVIGMRSLGKEDLLLHIADELQEWISLPGALYNTARILELPNVFCVNETNCRIRVEPFYSVSNKNMDKWNERRPTIAILPTALYTGLEMSPFVNRDDVFIVPYSDHSSYSELVKFVKFVKPKVIYPIVSADTKGPFGVSITDRADMSSFRQYLCKEQRQPVVIPDSVKQWMSLRQRGTPKWHKVRKRKRKSVHLKRKNSANGVVFDSDSSASDQERDENTVSGKSKGKKLVVKVLKPGSTSSDSTTAIHTEEIIDVEDYSSSEVSSPSLLVSSFSKKIDSPVISCLKPSSEDNTSMSLHNPDTAKKQLFPIFRQQKRINVQAMGRVSPTAKLVHSSCTSELRTIRKNISVIPINIPHIMSTNERKAPSVKALNTHSET